MSIPSRLRTLIGCTLFALALVFPVALFATDGGASFAQDNPDGSCVLTDELRQAYLEDGTLDERIAYMEALGNQDLDEALVRANGGTAEDDTDAPGSSDVTLMNVPDPETVAGIMPSTGEAKAAAFYVDFPDMTFDADDTEQALQDMFSRNADTASDQYPYESLQAYYSRSSYGKLSISADVFSYTAKYPRSHYTSLKLLFQEVLANLDGTTDFSQYDGDNDGYIDGLYLHFAGPNSGWGSTWWSQVTTDDVGTYDGKKTNKICVLHEKSSTIAGTMTLIHETGHMIGLPDLYSYNRQTSTRKGTHSWDMMESNVGDHNPYFKWMLGWIGEDQITRVVANESGITVSLAGTVIKTVAPDDPQGLSVEQTLETICSNDPSQCGGFAIVSNSDAAMFSNFFLLEYNQMSGNNGLSYRNAQHEVSPVPAGFRVYRIQGEQYSNHNWKYRNTDGVSGKELIYVLDEDLSQTHSTCGVNNPLLVPYAIGSNYGCQLGVGQSFTPTSSPSTNFLDSLGLGFTGLTFTTKVTDETQGTMQIGFSTQDKPDASKFTLTPSTTTVGNSASIVLRTPWKVATNITTAGLLVDGQYTRLYLLDDGNGNPVVSWQLAPGSITSTSKVQLVFAENTFTICYQDGQPVYSQAFTVDLTPTAIAPADRTRTLSQITTESPYNTAVSSVAQGAAGSSIFVLEDGFGTLYELDSLLGLSKKTRVDLPQERAIAETAQANANEVDLYDLGENWHALSIPATARGNHLYFINSATGKVHGPLSLEDAKILPGNGCIYIASYQHRSCILTRYTPNDENVSQASGTLRPQEGTNIQSIQSDQMTLEGTSVPCLQVRLLVGQGQESNAMTLNTLTCSAVDKLLDQGTFSDEDLKAACEQTLDMNIEESPIDSHHLSDGSLLELVAIYEQSQGTFEANTYLQRQTPDGKATGRILLTPCNNLSNASWTTLSISPDENYVAVERIRYSSQYGADSEAALIPLDQLLEDKTQTVEEAGCYVYQPLAHSGLWSGNNTYSSLHWTRTESDPDNGIQRSFYTLTLTSTLNVSAQDFTFTPPADAQYDGQTAWVPTLTTTDASSQPALTANVAEGDDSPTPRADIVASQLYYSADGGTTWSQNPPVAAGTYQVKADVTVGNSQRVVPGITSPDWTFQIAPRSVTLTSKSTSKTYDGTALICPSVIVGGDGFAPGEDATYTFSGGQTDVGSSANVFSYTLNPGVDAKNYLVTTEYGTLTVKKANPEPTPDQPDGDSSSKGDTPSSNGSGSPSSNNSNQAATATAKTGDVQGTLALTLLATVLLASLMLFIRTVRKMG